MEYPNNDNDRRRTRNNMMDDRDPDRMMHEDGNQKQGWSRMGMGTSKMRNTRANEDQVEEVYAMIDEHMCKALAFHSQLADCFCFLGLQGFKRMAEYQYMKECAGMRKAHRRYIDMHHRVLPTRDVKKPNIIPSGWSQYTTKDIDDTVISKYTKMALEQWYEWEKETKELYEEICEQLHSLSLYADYEYVKELMTCAEKECKKVMRMYENLNTSGYDVGVIHNLQDKYHEKYKKKYEDRFTVKNNYPRYDDEEGRERRRYTRVGY